MSIWVVLDFLKPILEREISQHASQRNVVTLEFGSQCSPRHLVKGLIARDLARDLRHGKQRDSPFYHDLF